MVAFALIGPTAADVRDVMIEDPSGILATAPANARPTYEPSKRKNSGPLLSSQNHLCAFTISHFHDSVSEVLISVAGLHSFLDAASGDEAVRQRPGISGERHQGAADL